MRWAVSLASPRTRLEFDRIAPGHKSSAARVKSLKSEGAILTVTETLRFSSEDMQTSWQLNSLHARNLMNLRDSQRSIPLPPTVPMLYEVPHMTMLLMIPAVVNAKLILANAMVAILFVLDDEGLSQEDKVVLEREVERLSSMLNGEKISPTGQLLRYPVERITLPPLAEAL